MSFAEPEGNATSSTTNSEEFEDAQDELRPLPDRSRLMIGIGCGSNQPLRHDTSPTESEIGKQLSLPSWSGNTSISPTSSSPKVKEFVAS